MKDNVIMTTELELIQSAQDDLLSLKRKLKKIQDINTESGRNLAANAAMKARAQLTVWHADVTEALSAHYPDIADGIQVRGGDGGGR